LNSPPVCIETPRANAIGFLKPLPEITTNTNQKGTGYQLKFPVPLPERFLVDQSSQQVTPLVPPLSGSPEMRPAAVSVPESFRSCPCFFGAPTLRRVSPDAIIRTIFSFSQIPLKVDFYTLFVTPSNQPTNQIFSASAHFRCHFHAVPIMSSRDDSLGAHPNIVLAFSEDATKVAGSPWRLGPIT